MINETGSYVFEFGRIVRKNVPVTTNLKRLYHLHNEVNRVKTSRANFNKLNLKIKNFSKQELMDAILTDSSGNSTGTFVRCDVGSSPDENRGLRDNVKLDDANPIESEFNDFREIKENRCNSLFPQSPALVP